MKYKTTRQCTLNVDCVPFLRVNELASDKTLREAISMRHTTRWSSNVVDLNYDSFETNVLRSAMTQGLLTKRI